MTNWIEYTGSDEQIAEIKSTKNGYVLRKANGKEIVFVSIQYRPNLENVTHYWTIPEDPLREMKIRHAQTGQPVWVRVPQRIKKLGGIFNTTYVKVTTAPDWNIPNAEYSFKEFE